ncbi:MAG TPA: hypothetical protein PKW55_04300 [Spirochaetota bacterium]|nr:hypothetical protein [Spirochaetota bacterium]HOM37942.1 hypothetical protein [Spirochaetota bacterium]HPQ48746.1 hypothetical protein [Spirochaetota bacterium]
MISGKFWIDWKDFLIRKIFHYKIGIDFGLEIFIDSSFIEDYYLKKTPTLEKRLSKTDIIVAVSQIKKHNPLKSRRFVINEILKKHTNGKKIAAEIIKASATIFQKSEPVEWIENNEKTYLIDGYYTDNIPVKEMFEDDNFKKERKVDIVFIINNSSLKNYAQIMEDILNAEKEYNGLAKYFLTLKSAKHYLDLSLSISGNDTEQIETSIMINKIIRSHLKKEGKPIVSGTKIKLKEFGDKIFTFKPLYIIEPENEDLKLLNQSLDKEETALYNYELGKKTARQFLEKIKKGKIEAY